MHLLIRMHKFQDKLWEDFRSFHQQAKKMQNPETDWLRHEQVE